MNASKPEPGQVIRYSYLWFREQEEGREEGVKDRPCAVVVAVDTVEGAAMVYAVPVTHTPPADPSTALELPAAVKRLLGLDDARSWIVLDEANRFAWPGPDLRPVPGKAPADVTYGMLPPKVFGVVRARIAEIVRAGRFSTATRTE